MDYEDQYILYVGLFTVSLLALLFTSYNTKILHELIIIYGLMLITGLSIYHSLNSVQEIINKG